MCPKAPLVQVLRRSFLLTFEETAAFGGRFTRTEASRAISLCVLEKVRPKSASRGQSGTNQPVPMESVDHVRGWLLELISLDYLEFGCDRCSRKRQCLNRFCIMCRKGSLCSLLFTAGGPHEGHPFLQVRKLTGKYVVEERDLAKYSVNTTLLQKFIANTEPSCFLKRSPKCSSKKERHLRKCHHCKGSMQSGAGDGEVCSIQCLIQSSVLFPEKFQIIKHDGASSSVSAAGCTGGSNEPSHAPSANVQQKEGRRPHLGTSEVDTYNLMQLANTALALAESLEPFP